MRSIVTGRRLRLLLGILALVLLAACAKDAPQDTLTPSGPIAKSQDALFKPVFWIAAGIFFLVEGLFVFAVIRFRDRPGREDPKQVHGSTKMEIGWTILPALLMLGVAIPTVVTIFDLNPSREAGDLNVRVDGKQWWWEYEYLDEGVITANELVIPIGRKVFLELTSSDVIHSFWVPKLAGKVDVVPGRTNTMELIASEPGEYYGQCAEFCSISHANMRLRVRALEPAAFEDWLARMREPASVPGAGDALAGQQLFANTCAACHQVLGPDDEYQKNTGPNLTHLADRGTFGAALYDLNAEELFKWVENARRQKPGVIMPIFGERFRSDANPLATLTDADIRAIVAYLLTLT